MSFTTVNSRGGGGFSCTTTWKEFISNDLREATVADLGSNCVEPSFYSDEDYSRKMKDGCKICKTA